MYLQSLAVSNLALGKLNAESPTVHSLPTVQIPVLF
jgi:hypothetical protein